MSTRSRERRREPSEERFHRRTEDEGEFSTRGQGPPKIDGMFSLKVDNITQRTGVNLLKKVFSEYGELGDIYVPRYPDTFASRGFAFVRYFRQDDAELAMRKMHGRALDGRTLSIQMARYARPKPGRGGERNGSFRSHEDYRNGTSRVSRYGGRPSYASSRRRSRSRSRFVFISC